MCGGGCWVRARSHHCCRGTEWNNLFRRKCTSTTVRRTELKPFPKIPTRPTAKLQRGILRVVFLPPLLPVCTRASPTNLNQPTSPVDLDLLVSYSSPSSARHGLRRICSRPRHSRSLGFSRKKTGRINSRQGQGQGQGQWPAAARRQGFFLSFSACQAAGAKGKQSTNLPGWKTGLQRHI